MIPKDHPRYRSLIIRERIIEGFRRGIVSEAGLIAHGRGECFDYLLGEKTHPFAEEAMRAAVAMMKLALRPVISVNGNAAALVPKELVELSKILNAPLEVNIFYRTEERVQRIAERLREHGADEILGTDPAFRVELENISHARRYVDRRGIYMADVVLIPLEDGDRTEKLVEMGKKTIAIDLNPLSRTAQKAHITIVDNIVRAMPRMIEIAKEMDEEEAKRVLENYDNKRVLAEAIRTINKRLEELSRRIF